MDRAQAREEQDRALALQAAQARIAASFAPRDPSAGTNCLDCEQPIEPARFAALRGCCSRCFQCAERHEHRLRGYREA